MEKVIDRVLSDEASVDRLADFTMFLQRSFLLDLSTVLNHASISYGQFFLLGYLAKEDYLTMVEISKKMGHSSAAAAGLVDRLEKLGYVQRLQAANDPEKIMVQITRKGLDFVTRCRDLIAANISEVVSTQSHGRHTEIQPLFREIGEFTETGSDESFLIQEINRGLPQEFWKSYRELKEKGEISDLDEEEAVRMTKMTDRIEEADAERLEAATKLANLRGVPFDKVLAEFEVDAGIH